MIQHEVTIHIDRPVEQVFGFVVDAKNLRTWQSNLVENEQLTKGPIGIGTRFREVRSMGPRQSEIQVEITDFEPNIRFATKTLSQPQATVNYTFEQEGGGTRLTNKFLMVTSEDMRPLEPSLSDSIKKDTDSNFKKLKHVLEGM
jgi:uncharacterized protein YndB with AHSA1/START domain